MRTHYIVQQASCPMGSRKWGRYVRIAVLEVDAGLSYVSMISERARGLVRIVRTWEGREGRGCSYGKTERSESGRALAEARALADKLNLQMGVA